MSSWWIDNTGRNNLKGVPGDPTNPPIIPEDRIVYYLGTIPAARWSFISLFPSMLPEEQDRLTDILDRHPFVKTKLIQDPQANSDAFSRALDRGPIRTTGILGGKRIGK